MGDTRYFLTVAWEARETVSWKQKWKRYRLCDEAQLNFSWFICTVVVIDCGQRLNEDEEAIVIVVQDGSVTIVHGWAVPFIRQEVAPEKVESTIRLELVQICRQEPEKVWKRGVTEKEMELVVVCMAVSLLVSAPEPVKLAMKVSGSAETVAEAVPQMMGALSLRCFSVSILTQTLKIGLVLIHTLSVMVMTDPDGMVENPEIWAVCRSTSLQTRVLVLTVEVRAKMVPSWIWKASELSCRMKEGSKLRGSSTVTVMYWMVERQNSMGAEGAMPSAVQMLTAAGQATVWKGMLSSLTSSGLMELQGRLYSDTAPDEISRGLQMLEMETWKRRPTANCSLKMTRMMLGLTTVIDRICGGVSDTCSVLTSEETVNWKLPEMVKTKVERGVGQATPTVTSMSRSETVVPGRLAVSALMETMLMRLLFLSQKKTCPMFQFSSCMTPVPLMAYISKLLERAPIEGRLLDSTICREQATPEASSELNPTTMVLLIWMLGLMALTAVELMVSLGVEREALNRLTQAVTRGELPRRVQEKGVMMEGKIGITTIRQDEDSRARSSWKVKMKFDGEDSVLGEAIMGPTGCRPTATLSSRHSSSSRGGVAEQADRELNCIGQDKKFIIVLFFII